ncbi:MAG TPA: Na(+)/H(+) antiporter subunit B [Desulfuromonadales bacterium]|nr:Na(+)/H(+) antiporter subunit B [Desulfuromonadales bacterium]
MKVVQERRGGKLIGESLITQMSVRLMVPFIQLFGLYVIAHGHYSPGGGFQGGVALGASFILYALVFGLDASFGRFSERANAIVGNIGVLIYCGTAALTAILGGLFLDYTAFTVLIPMEAAEWRSLGVFIVELGVGLAVMSIMVSLFWDLGSAGNMDEGL